MARTSGRTLGQRRSTRATRRARRSNQTARSSWDGRPVARRTYVRGPAGTAILTLAYLRYDQLQLALLTWLRARRLQLESRRKAMVPRTSTHSRNSGSLSPTDARAIPPKRPNTSTRLIAR